MAGEAKADLERELGPGLRALDRLSEEDAATLLTLFRDARRTQGQTVDTAIEEALGHVPKPLRGTARKILLGRDPVSR